MEERRKEDDEKCRIMGCKICGSFSFIYLYEKMIDDACL
jgi:hypothetical protein